MLVKSYYNYAIDGGFARRHIINFDKSQMSSIEYIPLGYVEWNLDCSIRLPIENSP